MQKKNIAILGGSFNPIHIAHLIIAQHVYDTNEFEEIIFMPTGNPPHKLKGDLANEFDRLRMCELAVKDSVYFSVSDFECYRDEVIYTVDTIQSLKEANKDVDFYMIIGADSLFNLPSWKDCERLLDICNFVVVKRPGYRVEDINQRVDYYKSQYDTNIRVIDIPNLEISSTDIRERINSQISTKYMVPDRVNDYIYGNGLYGSYDYIWDEYLERIKSKLKKKLVASRYEHTLSTMDTAIRLATIHGHNVRQAAIAALLHDCAKNYSDSKKYALCEQYGVILTKAERENIDLVHAKLGAMIAKYKYKIYDEEILSAITYHTTGKSNMTTLEKIIYIADFIEPLRNKAQNLKEARELALESLDRALYNILSHTVRYLRGKDKTIDDRTLEAYQFYRGRMY